MRLFSHIAKKIKFIPKVGLIVATFLILVSNVSFGQTTLYTESFGTNNKGFYQSPTKDVSGMAWDVSCTTCKSLTTSDWFAVQSNKFIVQDVDNIYTWTSNDISISSYSDITISLDAGGGTYSTAYYNIYYQIYDGVSWGSKVQIGARNKGSGSWVNYSYNGASWTGSTLTKAGLCGNMIRVIVDGFADNGGTETLYFDNVIVQGVAVPEPNSYPSTFSASPNTSCTQLDLGFSAANTITNATGYLILQKQGSLPTGAPSDKTAYSVGNTIGDGTVAAIITNTSSTSTAITGLGGFTSYYYKIFPYYYNGSNSCTYNYYTGGTVQNCNGTTSSCAGVVTEPSAQPASFTVTYSNTCKQLELGFSAANTISNCYGYLILRKQGSSPTEEPVDANGYAVGNSLGTSIVIGNVTNLSATALSDAGLTNSTEYYYSIFPYNYDGVHTYSYNYRQTGYLSGNATTIFCEVLVGTSVGGDNPGSGWDDPNVIHGNNSNTWSAHLYNKTDMHNELAGSKGSSVHNVITSICLDLHTSNPNWNSPTVTTTLTGNKIYMANFTNTSTLASEYSNEADLTSAVTAAGYSWTEVYSGDLVLTGYGWNTINLATPFYYNGTGSLLVKFTRASGNTPSNYPNYGYLDDNTNSNNNIRSCGNPHASVVTHYKYCKIAFNSTCEDGEILPIELSTFKGICNGDFININWSTASEINNDFFTIEKSSDAQEWNTLTTVPGAGTSNNYQYYSVTDEVPGTVRNYYRLKQTDYDGQYSYSDIISVAPCVDGYFDMIVGGNPVYNELNLIVGSSNEQKVTLRIIDLLGRTLYQDIYNVEEGDNSIIINVSNFGSGVYILSTQPESSGAPVIKEIIISN